MNHRRHAVQIAALLVALVAVGCSGSESQNLVPVDAAAPGVLYVSTPEGDIQAIAPGTGEASVFVSATDIDQGAVFDLAPSPNSTGMQALVRISDQPFQTAAVTVTASGLDPIDTASDTLACLDPHAAASIPVAHEAPTGGPNGADFNAVTFDGGTIGGADFDLVSVACPRWTADRETVATAIPTREGDSSSIVTVVQSTAGERIEVGFNGCGTTPTSFSPNDQFLAVALTCFAASWQNSGLYLLPVDELSDLGDLSTMTKLGDGLFGRTAWYPAGDWVAVVHADAIENQNIAMDLAAQPVSLQVIEVATLQTVDLDLADGASPFSVTWLETALGS